MGLLSGYNNKMNITHKKRLSNSHYMIKSNKRVYAKKCFIRFTLQIKNAIQLNISLMYSGCIGLGRVWRSGYKGLIYSAISVVHEGPNGYEGGFQQYSLRFLSSQERQQRNSNSSSRVWLSNGTMPISLVHLRRSEFFRKTLDTPESISEQHFRPSMEQLMRDF